MGQFDFLLNGAQGITPPNPIGLAQGALTVGGLANQYQGGQINLQMQQAMLAAMKDPAYGAAMGQLFGGATGAPAGPGSAPGASGFGSGALAQLFQTNPVGAMMAIGPRMQMVEQMAAAQKDRADAGLAEQNTRNAVYQQFTNLASAYGKGDGPLSDSQKRMMFSLAMRAGSMGAVPPDFVQEVAQHMQADPDGGRAFLSTLGVAGVNAGEQATAGKTIAETPLAPVVQQATANQGNARANLANAEAGVVPEKAAATVLDANANAAAKLAGSITTNPVTGEYTRIAPVGAIPGYPASPTTAVTPAPAPNSFAPANPQQAAALAALRARIAQGGSGAFTATTNGPVDTTASAGAALPAVAPAPAPAPGPVTPLGVQGVVPAGGPQAQINSLKDQLNTVGTNTQMAQRVLQLVGPLRQLLQTSYTGTLGGSQVGKDVLNLGASLGILSPDQVAKLSNSRASDALVTELLAPLARAMSSRGSNMAMMVAQRAKPGSENSLPVALRMATALAVDANNQIAYSKAINGYVSQHPNDYGLTGFNAPAPLSLPPEGGAYAGSLPDPAKNIGATAVGDDGTRYRSNGAKWLQMQ